MKKLKIILSILLLCSVVGSGVTFGLIYKTDIDTLKSGYSLNKYFELSDISNIKINSNCNISFQEISLSEKPHVEFKYNNYGITAVSPRFSLTAEKEGNVLNILLQNDQSAGVILGKTEASLTVYLPEKQFESVVINCDSFNPLSALINAKKFDLTIENHDIVMNNIYDELKIKSEDGKVSVNSSKAAKVDIYTRYGDIELSGNYKAIRAESKNGNVKISSSNQPLEILGLTSYGSIELGLSRSISGFMLDYDLHGGKLNSEFEKHSKLKEDIEKGIAYYGDKSTKINFTVKDGNISIMRRN